MFIVGNAAGPVFLGPLSDLGGRKWVYVGSVAMYGLCQIVGSFFYLAFRAWIIVLIRLCIGMCFSTQSAHDDYLHAPVWRCM